ncbi:MAG: hypothetical protein WA080_02655 [Sulfuricurvum sp.]
MKTLKIALNELYKPSTVRAILNGSRRPNLEKIVIMRDNHGIPIDAWIDIKQWLLDLKSMPDTSMPVQEQSENQLHQKESA